MDAVERAAVLLALKGCEIDFLVPQIGPTMKYRASAVKWLHKRARVQKGYDVQTFFASVNYLDRVAYHYNYEVDEGRSLLLCAVCLHIAAKLYEAEPPTIGDVTDMISQGGATAIEVSAAEREVCELLSMDLLYPSPLYFLDYFAFSTNEISDVKEIAEGLIESFAFIGSFSTEKASLIAAGALHVARMSHNSSIRLPHLHITIYGYTENQLRPIGDALRSLRFQALSTTIPATLHERLVKIWP